MSKHTRTSSGHGERPRAWDGVYDDGFKGENRGNRRRSSLRACRGAKWARGGLDGAGIEDERRRWSEVNGARIQRCRGSRLELMVEEDVAGAGEASGHLGAASGGR